jgi:IS5 family transposase
MKTNTIPFPKELAYDRGGKEKTEIEGVKILIPSPSKKTDTNYQQRKKRRQFRSGATIETIINHLKYDYRLLENYFWGKAGVQINALMAGTAWNMRKYIEKLRDNFLLFIFRLFFRHIFIESLDELALLRSG